MKRDFTERELEEAKVNALENIHYSLEQLGFGKRADGPPGAVEFLGMEFRDKTERLIEVLERIADALEAKGGI